MPFQDLTPQLRTRLSRMERAVGWFVFVAAALLLFGFGYYIYHTAERKGWFVIKAPFHTYVQSSAGLNVGDPVMMMGFHVGEITRIHPMPPGDKRNVLVEFEVKADYFRYIWRDGSYVRINSAGFLNQRQLEVTRGTNGPAIVVTQPVFVKTVDELNKLVLQEPGQWQLSQDVTDADSNLVFGAYMTLDETNLLAIAALIAPSNSLYAYNNLEKSEHHIVASWDGRGRFPHYKIFQRGDESAWLRAVETPPISDQLQAMVSQVQSALPGILSLTNKVSVVLDGAANVTSNLNATLVEVRPVVTNFALISGQLREPGGLGVWALGANGNDQVQGALTNVNSLLTNTDTNLAAILIQLSNLTSNLNAQVQSNTNLLGGISQAVTDADDLVQGLKRHWLLRSAFKVNATNAPATPVVPLLPPRMR